MTGETAAGQGPTSSADRRMAQDRYRAPRRPHRMVHALRTRWLREIREMRCRLASGCQRTSAGSSARPVKGSFAVADAMAQATLDRPALPGGFRQLSDEASPRLSWQPGDRTWHRPASPAHSPGQTNPHARHTRASRSRTLISHRGPVGAPGRREMICSVLPVTPSSPWAHEPVISLAPGAGLRVAYCCCEHAD